MKLKKLELIGFKSFVNTTVVTFEKEITAIVGPNGCGKSNIVDAIRWVMGEQSPKHLRGKLMEDVIFTGSDKKAPLSMASVELTFSTEGYQTPSAYLNHAEISIGRRVYRTGESEYFINKTPVRLKDIHDLFLGTGVGTKAYSIIEQGRISQILSARPEERRYYIEEAAGVSRFKQRKEEALRKIEGARQNCLRLSDLISEMERQISALDRQAKKAEKYRDLKNEFTKWDLGVSSTHYQKGAIQQDELEKKLKEFAEKEELSKVSLFEAEAQLEVLRSELIEKEREITKKQGELFEAGNSLKLSETNLRYKEGENERIAAQKEEMAREKENLQKESSRTEQRLAEVNEQKMHSDLDCCRLEEEVESKTIIVLDFQLKVSEFRRTVETMRDLLFAHESRLKQIETECEHIRQKKEEGLSEIHAWETELARSSQVFSETQKMFQLANGSLESLKQMKFNLNEKTDQISMELFKLKESLSREETELNDLRERLTLRKSRLHSLEQLQKNFEGYQEGTRSVLLRKQDFGEGGIFGTVADIVETTPEYEGAVSAVLGEKLQYVIVKTQEEGLQAVEYLKTASTGRSSFIPMQIRSYGEEDQGLPQHEGVLGPLSNYVSMKQEYRHLGDFLFGDVVLVSDLKKAISIWSGNGHKKTLVTLDGEVVDPTGVITGGKSSAQSETLLTMKREIKDLSQWVFNLESELQSKEQIRGDLALKADELSASLETVKHSSFEEELKIAGQGKDVDVIRRDIESLKKNQQELAQKMKEGGEAQLALDEAFHKLEEEARGLELRHAGVQTDFCSNKESLEQCLSTFETNSADLTQLKIEQAQGIEKKLRFEEELNRLKEEQLQLKTDLSKKEEAQEVLGERSIMVGKEMTHLRRVIVKKVALSQEMQAHYHSARETYEKEMNDIRGRELDLKESRTGHEEISRSLHEVTLHLADVRGELKRLSEQCLERHQLVLQDIYSQHDNPEFNTAEAADKVLELKQKLLRMGEVNTAALSEYEELKKRHEFLSRQRDDLQTSLDTLEKVVHKINHTTREKFLSTFNAVNERFQKLFPKLFHGGKARLMLTDENNLLETGVDIMAQPPGKKLQSITLLSGGEKALTAVSLIFSIFQFKPSPFCILDEVDAPLDESNVERFNDLLREMTAKTQFIVITHNKKTMSLVDTLFGITMQEAGVSSLVSVEMK